MPATNALFEALKPFLGPVVSHDEVKSIIDRHVNVLPHDFRSHQHSWRYALELCAQIAMGVDVENDFYPADATYWEHELRAFDGAYKELAEATLVSPQDIPAAAFVEIVEGLQKSSPDVPNESSSTGPKSDRQIVDEVNGIARILLRAIGMGYEVPEGHLFWKADDARSRKAWGYAVEVYEYLTGAEVHDALMAVEEDEDAGKRDILHVASEVGH